jgi:hypothetical protein
MIPLLVRQVGHGRLGLLQEHIDDHRDHLHPIHSCLMDLCYIHRYFSQSRPLCCYGDCFGCYDCDHQEVVGNVLMKIGHCIGYLLQIHHLWVVVEVLLPICSCEKIALIGQNCW